MRFFISTLSTTLEILDEDQVASISIKCITGTTTVASAATFKNLPAGNTVLTAGESTTIVGEFNNFIQGITITTTGTYSVVIPLF